MRGTSLHVFRLVQAAVNTNQVIHKTLSKTCICVGPLVSLRNLNRRCPLKFVHSSFHGVGHNYVQKAFQTFGFAPPVPVPEQKDPDPNFSSVICPNPEEGLSVLVGHRSVCQSRSQTQGFSLCFSDFDHSFVLQELSVLLAESENAPIVLATDPDADRLAVAEKSDG